MRAVEISSHGGPEVLRVVDVPRPVPRDDEVLVRVVAAGVSHADSIQRKGQYPPPPGASPIPGLECAGIVEGTGERVCALLTGGGYAEYVAVPRPQLLPVPANWTEIEAATLPENMFTVYDNLFTRARFRKGESILVHGGTSGIGSTAIMLAKAFGASFIATTAGSAVKCASAREIGADLAIDYKSADFVERVMSVTDGRGVDVVLDIVGGDYIARDVAALADDGRVVCLATGAGRDIHLDLGKLVKKRAAVMASSLRARSVSQKAAIARELLEHVWPLLPARKPVRPVVDSVYPLERVSEAHEHLDRSGHIGKIVLAL